MKSLASESPAPDASPTADTPLAIPFAMSPYRELGLKDLPAKTQDLVRKFAEDGYVIVDMDMDDFEATADGIMNGLAGRYPEEDRRIAEAWYDVPEVRDLATTPFIIETLTTLYGRRPLPFQTLNFDVGTGQAAHSDTIHFHCSPKNYMCGAWVALEDIDAENGPLFAYPGSHKLPDYDMTTLGLPPQIKNYWLYEQRIVEIMDGMGFKRREFHVKKGQAVIWAANLVHGGTEVIDPKRTRQSQVTHYYFEDGMYYFPMGSDPMNGKVTGREVIDLVTGKYVKHRNNGVDFPEANYDQCWRYERPLPDFITGTPDIPPPKGSPPLTPSLPAPDLTQGSVSQRLINLQESMHALRTESNQLKTSFEEIVEDYKSGHEWQVKAAEAQDKLEAMAEDNLKKDAYIKKRDQEFAYRAARRVTKTWRAVTGKPKDER